MLLYVHASLMHLHGRSHAHRQTQMHASTRTRMRQHTYTRAHTRAHWRIHTHLDTATKVFGKRDFAIAIDVEPFDDLLACPARRTRE
jgi:hypothetical protein